MAVREREALQVGSRTAGAWDRFVWRGLWHVLRAKRPLLVVAALGALVACSPHGASDARPAVAGAATASTADERRVRPGAANLLDESPEWLRSDRLALLTNQSSRVEGESLAARLAAEGRVVRLLAPEHGFDLALEAGAKVERRSSVDLGALAAVDVRSWYGADAAQRLADLEDIDVLLFDLPDVGARYFTYIGTMRLAMQAAAAAGVRFVVLDRPNPLGGQMVSGWVAEPEHRSLVASLPVPILHGMTIGELARMIQGEGWIEGTSTKELRLEVVPMTGWTRDLRWPATGLPWFAASPNLPTFEAALVYGGTCLFEGTTLNEGRGTEESFLQFGAPWLDAEALMEALRQQGGTSADESARPGPLQGVSLRPVTYRPTSMPGRAASPRFADLSIEGLRIDVVDVDAVRPLELGVALLGAVVAQAGPDVLERDWLTRLAGTERLEELLLAGASTAQIVASWQEDVQVFRRARQPYLLYDALP